MIETTSGRSAARTVPQTSTRGAVRVERLPGLDGLRPIDVAERFRDLPGLAVLESARPGRNARWSFLTADPVAVVTEPAAGSDPFTGARRLLGRMETGEPTVAGDVEDREDAAPPFLGGLLGYLSYDLGRRLEALPAGSAVDRDLPMLHLGLHDWVIAWQRRTGRAWLGGRACDGDSVRLGRRLEEVRERLARVHEATSGVENTPPEFVFRSNLTRSAYLAGVERVRAEIGRGEIYQANLTRRLDTAFDGDPWPLYRRLRTGDPALFSAYLDLGRGPAGGSPRAILSASPEPFIAVDPSGVVKADPIKGTRPRGRTRDEDRALAVELLASAKDRAENIMIVDVLRNDLGRISIPGSVRVPRLCRLERTAAVQHLVSTVTGQLAPDRDAFDVLSAAFPGGSITGAPKIRAMQILERLEPARRGPYTGALGWMAPDGAMATSILIRTFVADGSRLSLHVGGGITHRSDAAAEWEETVAKARGPLGAIGGREVEDA